MCEYSLEDVPSRPAKIGEDLVVTRHVHSITRGFTAMGAPMVAVCLPPGTELAFKAAACAHKQPSRRGLRTVRCRTWTRAATSGIMPRHACTARCRGTASRRDLPVAIGAVPSQSEQQVVSPLQCARHAAFPSPNARRPVDMWTTQGRCPHIHRPNSRSIHLQFDEF